MKIVNGKLIVDRDISPVCLTEAVKELNDVNLGVIYESDGNASVFSKVKDIMLSVIGHIKQKFQKNSTAMSKIVSNKKYILGFTNTVSVKCPKNILIKNTATSGKNLSTFANASITKILALKDVPKDKVDVNKEALLFIQLITPSATSINSKDVLISLYGDFTDISLAELDKVSYINTVKSNMSYDIDSVYDKVFDYQFEMRNMNEFNMTKLVSYKIKIFTALTKAIGAIYDAEKMKQDILISMGNTMIKNK